MIFSEPSINTPNRTAIFKLLLLFRGLLGRLLRFGVLHSTCHVFSPPLSFLCIDLFIPFNLIFVKNFLAGGPSNKIDGTSSQSSESPLSLPGEPCHRDGSNLLFQQVGIISQEMRRRPKGPLLRGAAFMRAIPSPLRVRSWNVWPFD